jgi:hypothetical protein
MPAKLAVQPRAYVNPNMEKKKKEKKKGSWKIFVA